ncbi:hypothetical protein [uncultured Acetobacteroides sp.]|uniref:hypothetical protein n=1 Tax=uncultured Acetobacteroides sp. TaxID=1760811 RepID=UPI0029F5852D|nr:hypothetical protein [uncultured Acetobacteroides sp.]
MKSTISDKLVKDHKTEIEAALATLESLINPNTPVLTSEERTLYGKGGGDSNKLLVDDVKTLSATQPQLNSPLIDWTEFNSDNATANMCKSWISRMESIAYKLESAKMMHDYDNYMDAIDQYSHLDYLSRNNVQGASEAHAKLKGHFKRAKAKKEEPKK